MSQEWQVTATKKAGAKPRTPVGPTSGQNAKFLGRIVIEVFEPDDRSSDGITLEVQSSHGTDAGNHQFAREVIAKLNTRFQRSK